VSTVSIVAASEVPWADVEHALTGGGDGGSCWCQWFLLKRAEFAAMSREDKREQLRRELSTADPAPALLARVEGAAAGWVRVGPRPSQSRLSATRVVASGSPEPADDPAVWAITCLVVRREYRRQGVAKALVEAAVRHAALNGARLIEAYPIDTDRRKATSNELFVGSVSLFAEHEFTVTARPTGGRAVMTRTVTRRRGGTTRRSATRTASP
jgi:GNAT superfamily N-acetyltransferase